MIFAELVKHCVFSNWNGPAFYPYRQILDIECVQLWLKSELSDDMRVCRMWLNNLSVYAGDLNIFYNKNVCIFHGQLAQKLISFTFEHPVLLHNPKLSCVGLYSLV